MEHAGETDQEYVTQVEINIPRTTLILIRMIRAVNFGVAE